MSKEDLDKYYKVLEVKPGSSWKEIKSTYRDLIKVWHPDRFSNDTRLRKLAEEKTKEINSAFKKLEEDHLSIKFSYNDFGESTKPAPKPPGKPATEQKKETGKKKASVADIKRRAEELLKKAKTLMSGNYQGVVDFLSEAIELDPFLEEAYVERGMAYIELKKFSLAIEDFNEAIKLNNKLLEAFRGRAIAQFESGNYSLAVKDFSTAIEMEPTQFPALYYYRGKAYEKMGLLAEAAIDLKRNERLIKSAHGNESEPDAVIEKTQRSYWMTHVAFGVVLCSIFIILYLSYGYLSKKAAEKTKTETVPAQLVAATPEKEKTVEKKSIDDFIKDKYDALTRSRITEKKADLTVSERKDVVKDGMIKVESSKEIKQGTPKPAEIEKKPQTDSSQKNLKKAQEDEKSSIENQKDTFDQWRKIKELEKSFPSFLER